MALFMIKSMSFAQGFIFPISCYDFGFAKLLLFKFYKKKKHFYSVLNTLVTDNYLLLGCESSIYDI